MCSCCLNGVAGILFSEMVGLVGLVVRDRWGCLVSAGN